MDAARPLGVHHHVVGDRGDGGDEDAVGRQGAGHGIEGRHGIGQVRQHVRRDGEAEGLEAAAEDSRQLFHPPGDEAHFRAAEALDRIGEARRVGIEAHHLHGPGARQLRRPVAGAAAGVEDPPARGVTGREPVRREVGDEEVVRRLR